MASRRLLVLEFVRDYIGRCKASPSYGEIAAALGTNRVAVYRAVKSLARDGLILHAPGYRGLALPSMRDEALRILRKLGWQVMDDSSRIAPGGQGTATLVTNQILPGMPVLDYIPPADGGGGGGGKVGQGGEIARGQERRGKSRRSAKVTSPARTGRGLCSLSRQD